MTSLWARAAFVDVQVFQDKNQPKHRRLLAFSNPVSPSESGLEGLLFCCAVTITWNVRKASTDNLPYLIQVYFRRTQTYRVKYNNLHNICLQK